jgi:hypothetical protein
MLGECKMSSTIYFAVVGAMGLAGLFAGRWLLIPVVFSMWVLGLTIAACAGAFHQTAEDSSGVLFYFAAWGSMFWVLAFILGTAAGRAIRWITRYLAHVCGV